MWLMLCVVCTEYQVPSTDWEGQLGWFCFGPAAYGVTFLFYFIFIFYPFLLVSVFGDYFYALRVDALQGVGLEFFSFS